VHKDKIAILGMSWGGTLAVSATFGLKARNPPWSLRNATFAAHVALYLVCDLWIDDGPGTRLVPRSPSSSGPLQIHSGTQDDYESAPDACPKMKSRDPSLNMDLHMYEGMTHAFDSLNTSPQPLFDPVAKNFKGAEIRLTGDDQARELAKGRILDFLSKVLRDKAP
jgi:dienelactone hydrolase